MIDTNKVIAIAEAKLAEGRQGDIQGCINNETTESSDVQNQFADLFVVHCTCTPSNEVELFIDSDTKVSIEACITLSRAIEAEFDRELEDFSLTVASAGIGSELRLLRQYAKLIGRSVEMLLKSGIKIIGRLEEATEEMIKLSYEQKQVVETPSGKKKKQIVEVSESYPFSDIKSVREYLDFK